MRTMQEVIHDSLSGEELEASKTTHYTLATGERTLTLDLGPESRRKLETFLKAAIEREGWQEAAPKRKTMKPQPTREERAAIAKFVEETGLGAVSRGGLVQQGFIDAWEAAGRPGV